MPNVNPTPSKPRVFVEMTDDQYAEYREFLAKKNSPDQFIPTNANIHIALDRLGFVLDRSPIYERNVAYNEIFVSSHYVSKDRVYQVDLIERHKPDDKCFIPHYKES